jgi:multidrug efflux pump subunit AcrB
VGLTLSDLARQVRQAFYGEEAQRIQRGRDDVRVMVRYPEGQRRSLGDLENLRIRTPAGGQAPFATVAEAQFGRGYAAIRRVDRARAINVTAETDPAKADPNRITAELRASFLPQLKAKYPGLRYTFEGERREQRDTMGGLLRGFAIAMFLIYALLAVPLRSYLQPLIIMSAIPFGLIGAVLGHILLGMDLTILSMFGTVALAGVVVNDNLVLVDYVNRRRRAGAPLLQAVRESGAARFRPILLTSMTTFAGLTPLMLEKSVQAQFLIPMGVSLAFGVMFATMISLLLVPSLYVILEDVKALLARVTGWRPASQSVS